MATEVIDLTAGGSDGKEIQYLGQRSHLATSTDAPATNHSPPKPITSSTQNPMPADPGKKRKRESIEDGELPPPNGAAKLFNHALNGLPPKPSTITPSPPKNSEVSQDSLPPSASPKKKKGKSIRLKRPHLDEEQGLDDAKADDHRPAAPSSVDSRIQSSDYFFADAGPGEVLEDLRYCSPSTLSGELGLVVVDGIVLPTNVRIAMADPSSMVLKAIGIDDSSSDGSSDSDLDMVDEGEGELNRKTARYWMTEEQTKKKIQMPCRTCGETGHDQIDCTHSKCSKCGALDEHDAYRCPVFVTCHRCGIKGHISQDCKNPAKRGSCALCGSRDHLSSNCHTIWRQYSYRSSDSREAAIDARKLLKGQPLLDGGEGYVGQSIWCFTCGDQGHWGLDCQAIDPSIGRKGISPFSSTLFYTGPFANKEHYVSPNAVATHKTRNSNIFSDGAGFTAPANPGAQARKKNVKRMQNISNGDAEDEDWFDRPTRSKASSSKADQQRRDLPKGPWSDRAREDAGRRRHDDDRRRSRDAEPRSSRDRDYDYDRDVRDRDRRRGSERESDRHASRRDYDDRYYSSSRSNDRRYDHDDYSRPREHTTQSQHKPSHRGPSLADRLSLR